MGGISISLVSVENFSRVDYGALEFFLVVRGSVLAEISGGEFPLNADDVFAANRKEGYRLKGLTGNAVIMLHLDADFLSGAVPAFDKLRVVCNRAAVGGGVSADTEARYRLLGSLLEGLYLIQLQKERGWEAEFLSQIFRLLQITEIYFSAPDAGSSSARSLSNIEDILSYLQNNYDDYISLNDVAGMAGLSPPYFSKIFKEKTGTSFLKYLNNIRLDHTVSRMLLTRDTILNSAVKNGFSDINSFNKAFIARYHETPGSYRKNHRTEDGPLSLIKLSAFKPGAGDPLQNFRLFLQKQENAASLNFPADNKWTLDLSAVTGTKRKLGK
jgi:AraC-like DNA-binding protein